MVKDKESRYSTMQRTAAKGIFEGFSPDRIDMIGIWDGLKQRIVAMFDNDSEGEEDMNEMLQSLRGDE